MTEPKQPADALAAYARLVTYADRVFLAVEELEQVGGMHAVARQWTAAKRQQAAAVLKSARDGLDQQLAALKELDNRRTRPGGRP